MKCEEQVMLQNFFSRNIHMKITYYYQQIYC